MIGRLALARTRVHRSEVMFSVLVVVLCRDRIAILSFSAGKLQISLIALFYVLKPFGSGRDEADLQRLGRAASSILEPNLPKTLNVGDA